MKIKTFRQMKIKGKTAKVGETVEVTEADARVLVGAGRAEYVAKPKASKAAKDSKE